METQQQSIDFSELTPEHIFRAVEQELPYRCTGTLFQLNSMENRVYDVEAEDENGQLKRLVIKFYRPQRWSWQQIADEHEFMQELLEAEIEIAAPLPLQSGKTMARLDAPDLVFAIWNKFAGRALDELLDDHISQMGRLLGRMHAVGALHAAKQRLTMTPETYGFPAANFLLDHSFLPPHLHDIYAQLTDELFSKTQGWFERFAIQRLHGDFHLGNVLNTGRNLVIVDFDDMVMGPPVQDFWLLIGEENLAENPRFQALIRGYEMMFEFDWDSLVLIEPLRTLRMVHYSAWIARRCDDPYFKKAFPFFGSDEYWRQQIMDLQHQKHLIENIVSP